MTAPEIWAAIVVTDRSESFALLCDDLFQQAADAGVRPAFVVVENSRSAASRRANEATLAGLAAAGFHVSVESSASGDPLHRSRDRLRGLIVRDLVSRPHPTFVWQLDDDVRLLDAAWRGDHVAIAPLHSHVRFLLETAAARPDIKVLVGQVSGDPPIPPIATFASRLNDLAANLRQVISLDTAAPWTVGASDVTALHAQDAYYDFSVDRDLPCWASSQRWLPRSAGATVECVAHEMLAEAQHIPIGAAFSRPILAQPERFADFVPGTRRGANAVFFDASVCNEHSYPVVDVGGLATRRSDMIGTQLVAHRYPGGVVTSGFSVLHHRTRSSEWPVREQLVASLLTDVFGALLARAVDARLARGGGAGREHERLARVKGALATLPATLRQLERLAHGIDAHPDGGVVLDLVSWARREVPGAVDGRVPEELDALLSSTKTLDDVHAVAAALTGGVQEHAA